MKRNGKRKNQIWMAGLLLCLGLVFLLPKEVKAEYTDRIYGNESTGKDQYAGRRDKICQHIDPLHGYF